MKIICPVCKNGKAQRLCPQSGGATICNLCCVKIRSEACGDCPYYLKARQYQQTKATVKDTTSGHFMTLIDPEVDDAVDAALAQAEAGRLQQAFVMLKDLLQKHPKNHGVHYGMGTYHLIKSEVLLAIPHFEKAVEIFPYFTEAYFNLGCCFQQILDIKNSIRAYQKVIQIGDSNNPARVRAQSFLADMEGIVRKSYGIDMPSFLRSMELFDRAFQLLEKGDWVSAKEGFMSSIAINERSAPSHGNLALCYASLGFKDKAMTEIDRALEIDPSYEPAMSNLRSIELMQEGVPISINKVRTCDYAKEVFAAKQ